eukprot:TRINITY_DN11418_c0_g1_i7.p1 TRINITY_DN11418_c0_g1~~TRINITY_DN11418_c0_g1_i7.p1  ORF type:complete len:238 (+),score=47.80 TRINITY_DN11418_c0_g1_i7:285-998(+)
MVEISGLLAQAKRKTAELLEDIKEKLYRESSFHENLINRIILEEISVGRNEIGFHLSELAQTTEKMIKIASTQYDLSSKTLQLISDILNKSSLSRLEKPERVNGNSDNKFRIQDLRKKINHLNNAMLSIENEYEDTSNFMESLNEDFFMERKPFGAFDSKDQTPAGAQVNVDVFKNELIPIEDTSEFLTNTVWPKSRMLFAIISKMSKEGLLNQDQKGMLKDPVSYTHLTLPTIYSV